MAERISRIYFKGDPPDVFKATFLDIGGAGGFLAAAMAQKGFEATTQDISSNAARWIPKANETLGLRVQKETASMDALIKRRVQFNIVNVSQVLEHCPDPEEFTQSLKKLVLPGGLLCIDTPNNDAVLWVFKNFVRKFFHREDFFNALRPPEHLWGYTKKGLKPFFERCGFTILSLEDYGLGDPSYQPASREWYHPLGEYFAMTQGQKFSVYNFSKQIIAAFDRKIFSSFFGRGGGLSAVLRCPL